MIQLEKNRSKLTEAQYDSAKAKVEEARASKELVASLQDEIEAKEKAFKQTKKNTEKTKGKKSVKDRIDEINKEIGTIDRKEAEEKYKGLREKKKSDLTADEDDWLKKYEQRIAELDTLTDKNVVGIDVDQSVNNILQDQIDKLQSLYMKQEQLNQVNEDYLGQLRSYKDYSKIIKDAGGIDSDAGKAEFDKLTNSMKNYLKALSEIDGVDINPDGLEEFIEKASKGEISVKELIEEFKKLAKIKIQDGEIEKIGDEAVDTTAQMSKLANEIDQVNDAIKALSPEEFEQLKKAAEDFGTSMGGLKYSLDKSKNRDQNESPNIDPIDLPTMEFSTALTKVGSIGMDIGALFAEVGAAIAVCFNEGATAGEKFTAVLTMMPAAAMTIADIIDTVKDMPQALEALGKGYDKIKAFDITKTGMATGLADLGGKLTATAAKGGIFSGVLGKLGVAFGGATASASGFLVAILPIAAVILAIAAAVAIGIAAFKKWKASTPEGKLEAVKSSTEGMAEAAEEANTKYENLLNTIESYDSAVDVLDGLTKGTQEYTNQLLKANEQARQLIELYDLMPDDYYVDDYGVIRFKPGVLEEKQQEYLEQAQKTSELVSGAQRYTAEQELNTKATELSKQLNGDAQIAQDLSAEEFQKIFSGIAETGGVAAFQSLSTGEEDEKGRQEQRDILVKSMRGSDAKWEDLSGNEQGQIEGALDNLNIFKDYETLYNKNNNSILGNIFSSITSGLSLDKNYQKSKYKQGIVSAVTDEDIIEESKNEAKEKWSKESSENVTKSFLDYLGKNNYIIEDNKVYKKDTSKPDNKGEEVSSLSGLTEEGKREVLADVESIDIAKEKGIQLENIFQKAEKTMTDNEQNLLQALVNGDLSSLTKNEIKAFKGKDTITAEDLFDTTTLDVLQSDDTFKNKLNEWLAGFQKSVNEYTFKPFDTKAWGTTYTNKMEAADKIDEYGNIDADDYEQLSDEYSEYFDIQADGNARLKISAEEFKAIVDEIETGKLKEGIQEDQETLQTAEKILNEKSGGKLKDVETLETSAQSYIDKINADEMTDKQAANLLKGSIGQTMQEALDVDLKSFGDTEIEQLKGLSQAWIDFTTALDEKQGSVANTVKSLDELREEFNNGTIDAEEYNDAIDATVAKEAELEDLDYKEILEYAEYLSENAEALEDVDDALQGNLKEAKKVAVAHAKLNKGVETLSKNWDKWNDAISSGDMKEIEKYLPDINDALKDMLDLTDENFKNLSDDFAVKNWKLIQDVVNGVEGSLEKLQVAASEDMILKIKPELEGTEMLGEMSTLLSELTNMAVGTEISINPKVDNENAFDSLVELLSTAGLTVDQINDVLEGIGWDPEIELVEMDVEGYYDQNSDGYQDVAVLQPDGSYKIESMPLSGAQALAQNGKIKVPKISGKKKSGGSGSYTPQKTPSKGGGGGGAKEPKYAEKKSTSEKTRYHTLQNQLEDLKDEYEALADASDRAFGQEKLDNIDAEIKKTDELVKKQEEYLKAIQSNLPVDKSVMTAYYNETIGGPAMQFDENGNISNYDQIQDAMFDKYNAMTSYDQDSLEWQTFEKKYEQLEKYIEQYEETYDLLREEEASYQELLNQRIDLELEKVQYKVEIQLEVPESQFEVVEYQLGRIEDDIDKTAESIVLLTKQAELLYDQIQVNKQGINEALQLSLSTAEINELMAGNMDVLNGKSFTEDQIDAIKDYRDNLLDLNSEFDDLREQVEETIMNAFDELHDAMDEGIDQFDHYNSMLESYKSIIETVGKDTLGVSNSLINTLSQITVENAINQVEATQDAYKALQQTQLEAEEALEKAKARGDEQSIKFWEDTLNEIQNRAEEAQEEMMSAWEEALTKIAEQFEAAVQTAVDAFNEAVYQLGGIEALSSEFDRQKEMADMYLDDYQKIYELSKLNRDINNSIDDTDSLAGKQKLKKLLGEINKLQAEGVKMSQYDLEYLQAEYDLRMAEIALEEAQRAKDTVRLQRDNEGNWSYIYTQNTEAVDEAQQKYEDALYAMQDLSSNYIDEISAQLIETSQEMQEALAAIRIEDYASIEEYYEEVERVQEQYQEQLAMQEEELNKAVANNKELYDTDWTNYHNATGYKISDTEAFATKFSDTLLGVLTNSESDTSNFTNILTDATDALMNELYIAAEQYYTNMANAMEAAGTSTGEFADDLATNVEQIKKDSEEAAIAVEDMAENMQQQMDNIMNKVAEWQRTYGEAMNEIINANLSVIESFNEMLATLSMDDSKVTVTYDIQNSNQDILDADQFDTGGYTGKWGGDGKYAVLHEKELVLNKTDTENMFKALKISREMLSTIELNARQASLGLGAMVPATIRDDVKETLEQVVTITAEFPNATDHNEIEEAFNTLINRASQYANRK